MSDIQTLQEQKAAIDKEIEELRRESVSRVLKFAEDLGITREDLSTALAPREAKSAGSLGKVAPKFRDPSTGATWTGRGLQPKWVREAVAAGKSIESFRIRV